MKFADTSFLVALLNSRDQWHQSATVAAAALDERVVTTTWVLVELGDSLSVGGNRAVFLHFVDSLSKQSQWQVVPSSPEWWTRGLDPFRSRPDKEWSLTDCISFVVMTEWGISDALTSDHHFEQAGFNIQLR